MTEKEINAICKQYNIKHHTINPDMSVDVNGYVDLTYKDITKLPLNFNKVCGTFNCSQNLLTTLEGCPIYVGGNFFCGVNKLTSFEYCPKHIYGYFVCTGNRLKTRPIVLDSFVKHNVIISTTWKF